MPSTVDTDMSALVNSCRYSSAVQQEIELSVHHRSDVIKMLLGATLGSKSQKTAMHQSPADRQFAEAEVASENGPVQVLAPSTQSAPKPAGNGGELRNHPVFEGGTTPKGGASFESESKPTCVVETRAT